MKSGVSQGQRHTLCGRAKVTEGWAIVHPCADKGRGAGPGDLAAAAGHCKMSHHEAALAGNAHDGAVENPWARRSKGEARMSAVCPVVLRGGAFSRAVLLPGEREGEHAPRLQAMARVEQLQQHKTIIIRCLAAEQQHGALARQRRVHDGRQAHRLSGPVIVRHPHHAGCACVRRSRVPAGARLSAGQRLLHKAQAAGLARRAHQPATERRPQHVKMQEEDARELSWNSCSWSKWFVVQLNRPIDDVQGGERSVLSGQRAACAAWPCL